MAPCCGRTYYCPTAGETECLLHGGFDICCDDPACPAFGRSRQELFAEGATL